MALKDILGKVLQSASNARAGSVLGIDVSSSTIKVVQLRRKSGRAVLETYGELALGPYAGVDSGQATQLSAQKIGEALKDLLVESKASTKNCGVAIPLSASLIHVIELPDLGEKRLSEMIPIEVRKYIPVSISEVLLDWRIIPPTDVGGAAHEGVPDGKKTVEALTVAIHKDTIGKYQDMIRAAGLDNSFFEIEVFSTIRSLAEDSLAPVMILDIGAATSKAFIVDRRVLRESHTISRGSQDITAALTRSLGISVEKAEEMKRMVGILSSESEGDAAEVSSLVVDSLLGDAHRVALSYEKRRNRTVGRVILAGGGSALKGLPEKAAEVFGIEVVRGNAFQKVETPAFLEGTLSKIGSEFAVAVGVALRKLEEAA